MNHVSQITCRASYLSSTKRQRSQLSSSLTFLPSEVVGMAGMASLPILPLYHLICAQIYDTNAPSACVFPSGLSSSSHSASSYLSLHLALSSPCAPLPFS